MTIDEAIKHAEEVAQENDNVDESELALMYCDDTECIENHKARCKECASEHRQLANWLKDYKRLLEQELKTRWIPVSERLPNHDEYIKNNGLFNVSDGNRSCTEWFDIYEKQMFGEPTIFGFRVDYAVTAWMPLPQPYKKESEG